MSPEALSELISSIAHNLVAAGQAGALTDELIPPVDKLAVMRPKDHRLQPQEVQSGEFGAHHCAVHALCAGL